MSPFKVSSGSSSLSITSWSSGKASIGLSNVDGEYAPPLAACSAAAAFANAFCRRFCFLRFTVGSGASRDGGFGGRFTELEGIVGVEGWEESEGVLLGTVMNFEPSLLVYLAVFRGDAGVGGAGFWLVAGIVRSTERREATP